ncbi:hypothetical protein NKDENANG_00137 [Candidatus Entotheonellaceae bacterium PAL068K]
MQRATYWLSTPLLLLTVLLWVTITQAAEPRHLTAHSVPHTVALLELYTSEGCNSCPPADSWVSSLTARGFQADQVIPLALHVDYWDDLGWPDRFANPLFTQRQRTIAAQQRSRTIYTPQVVLQGKDFRRWRNLRDQVERINRTKARANITLYVKQDPPTELEVVAKVRVPEVEARQHAALYVALYENNLQSVVTAGENRGHTLHHDVVVRRWIGPHPLDARGMGYFQRRLQLEKAWKPADLGVVVFVQNRQNSDVLQALALPLGK